VSPYKCLDIISVSISDGVVLDHTNTGNMEHGFESRSTHGCTIAFSCVDIDHGMGRSPVEGVLPKFLNGYIVSKVNSHLKEARGPNP